ncbi:peptidoglycan-binding protein [Streptomyces sp. A3M-1-3]|uniref:peptidoglycan-binding protein n=1 Tax=Streptomyces sp. A3M-1-3 TaxID=2962044 RepID=UPI0020B7F0CF|nr:peptidoglycan-binding protein [Streptomyces sp. A3M-1-3]MCP3820054.1 peptidoglycan-binding protein [Streptomyces sp. A3M-1-3]
MKTGPQKIPGASQTYFYGTGRYSGSDMEVNCGAVHTTEGRTLVTYSNGASAPNVTGVPDFAAKKIRWYQHFDVDESARALVNKPGGVQTNTANAFQIELVGTCDDKKKTSWGDKKAGVDYIYWPAAPEWALAEVAWLVRWLHDYHGVPLTCVTDWIAYGLDSRRPGVTPASYGANPARMSFAEWAKFTGWCGHQHVPENDHGDPGAMDFPRVIALAKGLGAGSGTTSPAPAPAPAKPTVDLSRLVAAARTDPPKSGTPVSYPGVKVVEQALVKEGLLNASLTDGHYGTATKTAYAKWQQRCGYSGADADGIPGRTTLVALGKKRGFNVVA